LEEEIEQVHLQWESATSDEQRLMFQRRIDQKFDLLKKLKGNTNRYHQEAISNNHETIHLNSNDTVPQQQHEPKAVTERLLVQPELDLEQNSKSGSEPAIPKPQKESVTEESVDDFLKSVIRKVNLEQIDNFNKLISLDPNDSEAFFRRGNAKKELGDKQGALSDYTEAIRLNPYDAESYKNRGDAKNGLGDIQGALSDYNEAIRLDPEFKDAYLNRGWVKFLLGDNQKAIIDYTESIRLKNSKLYIPLYYRGLAKSKLGDQQGAIADYTEAIRLKDKLAKVYYHRGLIKKEVGDKQKAFIDFREAAQLFLQEGDTEWYNKSRDRIRELGGD
jgi:tetratricopeptide (TPR) repeat protein